MKNIKVIFLIVFLLLFISCKEKKIEYFKNGSIQKIVYLKNGIKNGSEKYYYINSKVKLEKYFVKGKQEGLEKAFYKNENRKWTCYYLNGNLHGPYLEYYPDGLLKEISTYRFNQHHGAKIQYDQTGKISCFEIYEEDSIIYGKYYKAAGLDVDEIIRPIIKFKNDTVSIGDTLFAKISDLPDFINYTDRIEFYISPPQKGKINDTRISFKKYSKVLKNIIYKPKESGVFYFYLTVKYPTKKFFYELNYYFKFYVAPPSSNLK